MSIKWRSVLKYSLMSSGVIALLYGWLMTLTGLHLTLWGASHFISGTLKIEKIQGRLLGPLYIQQLSYQEKSLEIKLKKLNIEFSKKDLLKGKWNIQSLELENFNMQSEATGGTTPDVFALLQRIRIQCAKIKALKVKTVGVDLVADGAIAPNERLNLKLAQDGLEVEGHIKTHPGEDTHLELIAHSVASSLKGNKIPALQISAHYQNSQCSMRLTTVDPEKPINEVNFVISMPFSQGFLSSKLIEVALHATCKDFSMLESMGLSFKDYPLIQSSGPMTIDVCVQDSLKHLKHYLQHERSGLLGKYLHHSLPKKAELSIRWQDLYLLPWGVFKSYAVKGTLKNKKIDWDAILKEAPKPDVQSTPSAWQLQGETACLYKKQKRFNRKFLREKSLHLVTHLKLKGDPLTFLANTDYTFSAIPNMAIRLDNQTVKLSGEVHIPEARFQLTDPPFLLKPDPDIYFVHSETPPLVNESTVDAQLVLTLGKKVYLGYGGLNARLGGALALNKKEGRSVTAKGEIKIVEGGYQSLGQTLKLAENARLIFTERLSNPTLDIEASRDIEIKPSNRALPSCPLGLFKPTPDFSVYSTTDLKIPLKAKVGVHLRGDLTAPSMHLFSRPASWISDPRDRLSYIVTGQAASHLGQSSVSLLLNTTLRLGRGYMHYHEIFNELKPFDIVINQGFEKNTLHHRMIGSYQYNPDLLFFWTTGFWGSSHALGLKHHISKHITLGGNLGYKAAHGFEMSYQREWS